MVENSPLMSLAEAAELLGISLQTAQRKARQGQLIGSFKPFG